MNRRWLLAAPLVLAGGAGVSFLSMLRGMETGGFDPRSVGHPLLGKPVPPFSLPGLTDADLRGRPATVLNFFASWCAPCAEEAPALLDLKVDGAPLFGIAYKDRPDATAAFLDKHGDPYARIAADAPGSVAIDFGVTGVPETFLIDAGGVIRWHTAGPMTARSMAALLPLLRTA